jgi:hypothetical protein
MIANDSETLSVRLRGIDFAGPDFDSLTPVKGATPEQLGQFTLYRGDLCSCRIQCEMPVPIAGRIETIGTLRVDLVLGDPVPPRGLDREELRLVLEFDGQTYSSHGTSGWFEDELLSLQSQLPEGGFIKACINCLYSDYSPAGHGLFGGMMCFQNLKTEYLQVRTKQQFWPIHDRRDRLVQETYSCSEFELGCREPGIAGSSG